MSIEEGAEGGMPQSGDVISGRYAIDKLIGRGGFGAVFRGRNLSTDRPIAIKWLLPQVAMNADAMLRFLAEAKVTGRIEHPNVVSVFDVGRDERSGAPFIVMELLRGRSLREQIETGGRMRPGDAVSTLVPAFRGVMAAHQEGVVHRDLKPDNIFLCEDKNGKGLPAKVVDFGISKLFEGENGSTPAQLTKTGGMIGTPGYMSPEQLNAPKKADVRFDVYALGVVLYETLTGVAPYQAEGLLELIQLIAVGRPTPPRALAPMISTALEELVLLAMHPDMNQRVPTVEAFIAALESLRDAGDLEDMVSASVATLQGPAPRSGFEELESAPARTGKSAGVDFGHALDVGNAHLLGNAMTMPTPEPASGHTHVATRTGPLLETGGLQNATPLAPTPLAPTPQTPTPQTPTPQTPTPQSAPPLAAPQSAPPVQVTTPMTGSMISSPPLSISEASPSSSSGSKPIIALAALGLLIGIATTAGVLLMPTGSVPTGSMPSGSVPTVAQHGASGGENTAALGGAGEVPPPTETAIDAPSQPEQPMPETAEPEEATDMAEPARLSYADLADGSHEGERAHFSGQVYGRQVRRGTSHFQLRLVDCEGECVLWVDTEGAPPALGAGVDIHGRVQAQHTFRSVAGARTTIPSIGLEELRELEGFVAQDLSLPEELQVVRRRHSGSGRPSAWTPQTRPLETRPLETRPPNPPLRPTPPVRPTTGSNGAVRLQ